MKLLFSEYKSDYSNYIFPYAIWAMPEKEERPALFFEKGFLPSSYDLNRYYMCRHIRVNLADFEASSENRRVMRKGEGISFHLLSGEDFDLTKDRAVFCKRYADLKFGEEVMSIEKLQTLFSSPVCSHVLVFTDEATSKELGFIVLHIDQNDAAFYYYAFYDLDYPNKSLGMYMMTATVALMQEKEITHIYLGSCYSKNALYKTQFKGCEFWNGFRWAENLNELKYLIKRDGQAVQKHLLETEDFINQFYQGGFEK
jgi:arginyl-tRNA--protein-N-Asp/Glu arginylyltransferase